MDNHTIAHDPEQIAAGLSEAQKDTILFLNADWLAGPDLPDTDQLASLRELDLVERCFGDQGNPRIHGDDSEISIRLAACWYFRLTPLGLDVRALISKEKDNG